MTLTSLTTAALTQQSFVVFPSVIGGRRDSSDTFIRHMSNSNNDNEITPTWKYEPYAPPPPKKRQKGNKNFKVPSKVNIPEDKLELSFVRSSGAGGQNVNKVNTKVEVRLHVMSSTFLPQEVRERIMENEYNRIGKDGYLTVSSQEYRTQGQNRKDALDKLEGLIMKSYPRPKVRKMRTGISKTAKKKNMEFKKRRSMVKQNRKSVDF